MVCHKYHPFLVLLIFILFINYVHGKRILEPSADFPFKDVSLSWTERVDDLVSRLSVEELTQQMANGGRLAYAPGIPRLDIPPYMWGDECLHGDELAGPATGFPQALGLAASFSRSSVFEMARATGVEVRAKYEDYQRKHDYKSHTSASCWSPTINIMFDPRWGRNQETYGEDPWLTGEMSEAYVHGLQGDHDRYVMAITGCKHFDVYAGPENIPQVRYSFDAKVSMKDWRMTFLPAFRKCVEAGTLSLMCSYNSINGIPACGNKFLLTDILRGEWGFQGYVVSDGHAIKYIMDYHNYTKTKPETAAVGVKAGCNLEDGPDMEGYYNAIPDAIKEGLLTEEEVREAAKPLFYARMRLGTFDPPEMNPYTSLDVNKVIQSPEHRALSIKLAMKSFVLMKNEGNILPLKKSHTFNKVAIVGPLSNDVYAVAGSPAPDADRKYYKTPLDTLKYLGHTYSYTDGCKIKGDDGYNVTDVKNAIAGSDLVILCLGTGSVNEAEANDRRDINLPGKQLQLLKDAVETTPMCTPVILLLFNAGPLDISWAVQNPRVPVIMECFFPHQATGEALIKVLQNDGEFANPAARLPATWQKSLDRTPAITNYTMIGRTYRYIFEEPLFPFGYGLSYTKFHYSDLQLRPSVLRYGESLTVEVYVTNIGELDGEEVVQTYVQGKDNELFPKCQLVGFDRIFIPKGQGRLVTFKVKQDQLAVWDEVKGFLIVPGTYIITVGGQQSGQIMNVGSNVLEKTFAVLL